MRLCRLNNFRLKCVIIFIMVSLSCSVIPAFAIHNDQSYKPHIVELPENTVASVTDLEFICRAKGNPTPVITWYNASTSQPLLDTLPTGGSQMAVHVNQHFGRLMISNPVLGFKYYVYCNASNSLGWTISDPPVYGLAAYLGSEFQTIPQSQVAYEGESVSLECEPPIGIPEPDLIWMKGNETIISRKNGTLYTHESITLLPNGALRINPSSLSDSGDYMCVAVNVAGKRMSPTARLNIRIRELLSIVPRHIRVRKGEDAKLMCPYQNKFKIIWRKNNEYEVLQNERVVESGGYLWIKSVQAADAGVYTCTAGNSPSIDITLTVEAPPTFLQKPDNQTVNVGDEAIFYCVADGSPKPSIYWESPSKLPLFPSENNSPNDGKNQRHYVYPDGRLEITNVQLSDAGRYQCIAHSSVDIVHTSAILKVLKSNPNEPQRSLVTEKPKRKFTKQPVNTESLSEYRKLGDSYILPPFIGLPPANGTHIIGQTIVLDCKLPNKHDLLNYNLFKLKTTKRKRQGYNSDNSGRPKTKLYSSKWYILWSRITAATDGYPEDLDSSGFVSKQRYRVLEDGSLQIFDLQLEDAGLYICTAQMLLDSNKPKYNIPLATQYKWVAEIKVVRPPNIYIQQNFSTNPPLLAPENLSVTNVTNSAVTISWDPPNLFDYTLNRPSRSSYRNGISLITYWIELYRSSNPTDGWIVLEKNWPATSLTLENMEPQVAYYILIRSRWNEGRVGWSSTPFGPLFTLFPFEFEEPSAKITSSQLKTYEPSNPMSHPDRVRIRNLQLIVMSTKSIHVRWSVLEPLELLSLIQGYNIHYRTVEHSLCIGSKTNLDSSSNYCSLSELNQTNMFFGGNSLTERLMLIQKLHEDEQSSNLNYTNAMYSSVVSTITIEVSYPNQPQTSNKNQDISHQLSALLTDLKPFRCYEVEVRPFGKQRISKQYEETGVYSSNALTYESVPSSPPQNIFSRWLPNRYAELGWTAPPVTEWNGLLLGYIIYVQDEQTQTYHSTNLSFLQKRTVISIGELPEICSIQIAAYTCSGIGTRSEPIRLKAQIQSSNLSPESKTQILTVRTLSAYEGDLTKVDNLTNRSLQNNPWFISAMVSIILLVLISLVIGLVFWIKKLKIHQQRSQNNLISNGIQSNGSELISVSYGNHSSSLNTNQTASPQNHLLPYTISLTSASDTRNVERILNQNAYQGTILSSDLNTNGSLKSSNQPYTDYSDDSRKAYSIESCSGQYNANGYCPNGTITERQYTSNINNVCPVPNVFHSGSSRFVQPSLIGTTFYPINGECMKMNNSHLHSPSQASSEPCDSAICLDNVTSKPGFNGSTGSTKSPTKLESDVGYAPVTPYASASIIQSSSTENDLLMHVDCTENACSTCGAKPIRNLAR